MADTGKDCRRVEWQAGLASCRINQQTELTQVWLAHTGNLGRNGMLIQIKKEKLNAFVCNNWVRLQDADEVTQKGCKSSN